VAVTGEQRIRERTASHLVERSLRVPPHERLDPSRILLSDASVPTVEDYHVRERVSASSNETRKGARGEGKLTIKLDGDCIASSTFD
jgi:hypothetical protein